MVSDGEGERFVLKLHPLIAPVKAAIFPLLKNKPQLVEKAEQLYKKLSKKFMCEYDDNGNIGRKPGRDRSI